MVDLVSSTSPPPLFPKGLAASTSIRCEHPLKHTCDVGQRL